MRFLIIQPSWDHSEILTSLLYYIKEANHQVKIIYDWSHPEGNYLDYLCELYGFDDKVKINYKSPKYHLGDCIKANYIIFVDEIHLRKFLSKNVYLEMRKKILSFNHISKIVPYEIKVLHLGNVPYKYCINENKYLVNNYYNPNIKIKKLDNKMIKFLIVGNPKDRNIEWLKYLPKRDNYIIYYIHRKISDINHPNVIIKENLATKDLINLINEIDYVLTLFKEDSCYYKDRISGIIPYAISFIKPVIMDDIYNKINDYDFTDNDLIYQNKLNLFIKKFEKILEIKDDKYQIYCNKILKYRDIKITEQYLNFHLLFNGNI